jgi:hypothetical protein
MLGSINVAMKKARCAVSSAILAIFVTILSQTATAGTQNIPPLSGQYSIALQGSTVDCYNASNAPEACSTSGATVVTVSIIRVGHTTYSSGVGCQEATQVVNTLPPNGSSPRVGDVTITVQATSYDSTTGLGEESFIVYSGGSCSGATFNSNGATEIAFGTVQTVVTEGGKLAHLIVTELEAYPTNNVGGVSITAIEQKQTQ